MVRLIKEYTSFVTGNISDALAAICEEIDCHTITLNGGHGESLGLKACGVAWGVPICPVNVDSSPGEKAIIVDRINVEPQSSLACRRWKLRYMDGDVLALYSAGIHVVFCIIAGSLQRIST